MKFNIYCSDCRTEIFQTLSNFKINKVITGSNTSCYEIELNTAQDFVDLECAIGEDIIVHHNYCGSHENGPHDYNVEIYNARRE